MHRRRRSGIPIAVIIALAVLAGAFLVVARPATTYLGAAPVDLGVPAVLSGDQLHQWCVDRIAAGTSRLSTNARNWLKGCAEATAPTTGPTSSAPATPSQTPTVVPTSPTSSPTPTPTATSPTPTATPTPTPTPTSSGWPDATNTGAGDCTRLTPSAGFTVSVDGTVVEDLAVTGAIRVEASNVTIRHVCLTNTSPQDWAIVQWFGASGLSIEDVTIEGDAVQALGQGVQNFGGDITVERANIAGVADGVATIRGLVADSYIHDPSTLNGAHIDLIQATSGADDGDMLTVTHNTLLNPQRQTGVVSLFQDFGVGRHARITGNLLAGGGYTLYAGGGPKGLSYDIQITGNVFDRRYFPQCGANGPVIAFDTGGPGNVWSGNVYDNGAPVTP